MHYANGDIYVGSFDVGLKQGAFTFHFNDGRTEIGRSVASATVGEGVRWSMDRATMLRLLDGKVSSSKALSASEVRTIAEGLGLPEAPPVRDTCLTTGPSRL